MGSHRIRLFAFGAVEVRREAGGDSTTLEIAPKYRSLLAYLVLAHPREALRARETLTSLFWPEQDHERARSNLRKAVYELRRQIGPGILVTRGKEEIGVDRDRLWCDAVQLDDSLDRGDLEAALELYRGELLAGLHVAASAEFERWLEGERTRLRTRVTDAIRERAAGAQKAGRVAEAARWYRRTLEVDPYDENSVQALMLSCARLGDRAGAIQEYEAFAQRLREDLDLEPANKTLQIAEKVRKLDLKPSGASAATPAATAIPASPSAEPSRKLSSAARPRGIAGFAIGLVVVLGLLGLYLADRNGAPSGGTSRSPTDVVPPAIAVVPFQVNDPDLAVWSEGLVDLLSTNLDGVGGLRAISSRTLLARWHLELSTGTAPNLATTLDVARGTGATHVVVGSAVSLGSDIHLSVDVYALPGEHPIGSAEAAGSVDSVFGLVDQLSIGILGVVLGDYDGTMSRPRLATLTTRSLPALEAFLQGEEFHRRSAFREAAGAYERAVESDSSFALAWYRLSQVNRWLEWSDLEDAHDRAFRLVERLPPRDAALVRGEHLLNQGAAFRALEILRQAAARYPDDPETWYNLGEVYLHLGGALLADLRESEEPFSRSVELAPGFAPYRLHLVDLAFLTADGATAAERIRAYTRLAPDSRHALGYRLSYSLAFGDSTAKSAAWAVIDTVDTASLRTVHLELFHPRFLASRERVLRQALSRPDLGPRSFTIGELARTLEQQGRLRATFTTLRDTLIAPHLRAYLVYRLGTVGGMTIPADLRRALDLPSALGAPPYGRVFFAAANSADEGRWAEHARAIDSLRAIARRFPSSDSLQARVKLGHAVALEGYGLWRRGQLREALARLETSRRLTIDPWEAGPANSLIRWWTGKLLSEMGRERDAARYFESVANYGFGYPFLDSFAHWELGRIYEEMGDAPKAVHAYQFVLDAWQGADPELRGKIDAAREAVARLVAAES